MDSLFVHTVPPQPPQFAGRRGALAQSAETVAGEGRGSSPWPPAAAPDEEEPLAMHAISTAHVALDGQYERVDGI